MSNVYFRTGPAAKQLETSPYHVRRLCEAGLIEAELTPRGQWRIPATELERLKRKGIPPVPQMLPEEEESGSDEPSHFTHRQQTMEPHESNPQPSQELITSAEEVTITENRLRKRKVELEAEEVEDRFRERARCQEAEQAAQRQRAAEVAARSHRQQWENKWITLALELVPRDAPPELKIDVNRCVGEVLAQIRPDHPDSIIKNLVDAAVEKALAPWRRGQKIDRIVESAVARLPYGVRLSSKPTEWQLRARDSTLKAVRQLAIDASLAEVELAASRAVDGVGQEFEHLERCRRVVETIGGHLFGDTPRDREEAKEAVTRALASAVTAASQRELEEIRDQALQPFKELIARRQDQDRRRQAIDRVTGNFPWGMDEKLKERALTAVRTAVGKLPPGASFTELCKAGDVSLQPFLLKHQRRENKKKIINEGLGSIYAYLEELSKVWDFGTTAWALEQELKETIRQQLEIELTGDESTEQVRKRIRRLVREELGV